MTHQVPDVVTTKVFSTEPIVSNNLSSMTNAVLKLLHNFCAYLQPTYSSYSIKLSYLEHHIGTFTQHRLFRRINWNLLGKFCIEL